jgi:hypothetical protein
MEVGSGHRSTAAGERDSNSGTISATWVMWPSTSSAMRLGAPTRRLPSNRRSCKDVVGLASSTPCHSRVVGPEELLAAWLLAAAGREEPRVLPCPRKAAADAADLRHAPC